MISGNGKFGAALAFALAVSVAGGWWLGGRERMRSAPSPEPITHSIPAPRNTAAPIDAPRLLAAPPITPAPASSAAPNSEMGPFAPPQPSAPSGPNTMAPSQPLPQQSAGLAAEEKTDHLRAEKPQQAKTAPAQNAPPSGLQPLAWMRNASAPPPNPGRLPVIAIVIDDLGAAAARVDEALALPAPITLAVLPYARDAARIASAARARGHEVLVHLPMEAENAHSPGPQALSSALTPEAFAERLEWNLTRFSGYAGVNNHMGSRLTQNRAAMAMLMAQLKQRGLLFLDSRTAANTIAATTARLHGLTTLERDIFLDNEITPEMIRAQLDKTEATARRNGYAIAIGHPHAQTIEALTRWAAGLKARGFVLAPLTAIARLQTRGPRLVALPAPGE